MASPCTSRCMSTTPPALSHARSSARTAAATHSPMAGFMARMLLMPNMDDISRLRRPYAFLSVKASSVGRAGSCRKLP